MQGSCLCEAVSYRVTGTPTGLSVCHCSQCRKQSGHVWASAHVPDEALEISGQVTWFQSSPTARRGFCALCGSFLFWKDEDDTHVSFSLGSLDGETGLRLERHIFTESKGDYYEITDTLPKL